VYLRVTNLHAYVNVYISIFLIKDSYIGLGVRRSILIYLGSDQNIGLLFIYFSLQMPDLLAQPKKIK
jgi:hypothetical protein